MKRLLYIAALLLTLVSCEKMPLEISEEGYVDDAGNVRIRLFAYEQIPMTRAAVSITELCSRFNVSIFDSEGDKVTSASQHVGDTGFGTISLTLAEGSYTLIAIGHNKENSVPISSTTKIEFSGGPTDVFYYYGTIDVTKEPQDLSINMVRAVGLFRLTITDTTIPEGVAQIKLSVTGGSQNLDPSTGYGCTKSTQKLTSVIDADHKTFDIYTFPRQDSNTLNVTVSALASDDTEVVKKEFENVPISVNNITSYRGEIFSNVSSVTATNFSFKADPDWGGVNNYDF